MRFVNVESIKVQSSKKSGQGLFHVIQGRRKGSWAATLFQPQLSVQQSSSGTNRPVQHGAQGMARTPDTAWTSKPTGYQLGPSNAPSGLRIW